jgi:hypothetical protein
MISRGSSVLPFRANHSGVIERRLPAGLRARMPVRRAALLGRLLSPIDHRLDLHQAHEGAAEGAGACEAETRSDISDAFVGFREQMASRVDPDFRYQLAVARADVGEMAL